jgi:hypothetical protein
VTGYQGGIQNEDYLLVKQSDAHAWAEVWVKDKGWLRVDPTAAVSPLRVEHGSQALMSKQSRNWLDSSWYRKLGERYDGMRHKWNRWVRDYNAKKQKALFQVFGFDSQDGKSIAIVLGIIMVITTLFVMLFLFYSQPKRKLKHYDKMYNKFSALFSKDLTTTSLNKGPIAFAQIAIVKFPKSTDNINEFTALYLKLRFSKQSKSHSPLDKRLLLLISRLKKEIKTI